MKRIIITLAILATLAAPQTVNAAPRCPGNGQCVGQIGGMTCAWPFVLVKVGKTTLCAKLAVQP